jgi:endo-1,4-beta-xylanase
VGRDRQERVMRAGHATAALTVLLGAAVCSNPYRASKTGSEAGMGVGGLETGGVPDGPADRAMAEAGALGNHGDSATASGGSSGAGNDVSRGGPETPEAGGVEPSDGLAESEDTPMAPVDARMGADHAAGADAGGSMATGGVGGGSGTGFGGGGGSAGGAGGGSSTGPRRSLKKFVGNSTTEGSGTVGPDFVKYWDQLSIGPLGHLGAVRSGPGQYDWSKLDPIYDFARKNHIPLHQYAFIWGPAEPRYFATDDEARAGIEDWIRSFCARYPDTELINVVYEPLHTPAVYGNALGGAGASGYDWIVQAFVWARTHCPNSLLLVTDYNNIEYQSDNQTFVKLVGAILAAGAPVDAIGAEGIDAARLPTSTIKAYIDRLAAVGLPIYITSYGIGEADDAKQESVMKEQFPLLWTDDRIRGITFWGYVVGNTWRNGLGLVYSDGTQRPAMTWLMSYLGR